MPQVEIKIGGRSFDVACQDGEEQYLLAAAAMLDTEANALSNQIGRMPESRMLLMAGLLLADKTAGLEDKVRAAEAQAAEATAALQQLRDNPEKVEVPVVPASVTDTLAELAARAEAVAEELEEKTA